MPILKSGIITAEDTGNSELEWIESVLLDRFEVDNNFELIELVVFWIDLTWDEIFK